MAKRALEPAVDGGPAAATSTHRKRARKDVVNDKLLLLKLPGELRNRIYEYIMEDVKEDKKDTTPKASNRRGYGYRVFRNDEPIHIKYTSIKSRKRYKNVKQWTAAHERRPYFGLTQACRILRKEFRPLYMDQLRFCIDLHVGQYLAVFGSSEDDESIGQPIANIMQAPLSDDGANLLPFLERLHELKQPRLDNPRHINCNGQRSWNRDSLLAILCSQYKEDTVGLAKAKTGITGITLIKSLEADRYHRSSEIPMLIMDLDAGFFASQTQQFMKDHSRKLLYRFELEKLDTLITQFRCGGESFTFRSKAEGMYGEYSPTALLLRDEDL